MKILAFLFSCFLALLSSSVHSEPLRIGVDTNLKPFVYLDSKGQVSGFDIDIANAICKSMNRECRFVVMDWDGLIPSLRSRKDDALITSMSITEERERVVDFTRPYYKSPSQMVMRRDALSVAPSEIKIAVLRGSTDERYAKEVLSSVGYRVVGYGNHNEAFMDLKVGRVQAMLGPQIELIEGLKGFVDESAVSFVGEVIDDEKYFGPGIGIAVRNGDKLRDTLNAEIVKLRESGEWKKISDRYFTIDIWPY